MGNYISCAQSTPPNAFSGVKVMFPGGDIQRYDHPINAAELMLEEPNHFVVNSQSLIIGRRFSALSADEDLEIGNVYVMFPMKRVNSVVGAADMAGLFMNTNPAVKRSAGGSCRRILPENGGAVVEVSSESGGDGEGSDWGETNLPRLNMDEIEDVSMCGWKHRSSMGRLRKPLLETIVEEPV